MNENIAEIIAALNHHLESAELVEIGSGQWHRRPVDHITCRDGTVFSIQVGQYAYCFPKRNHGPWTAVEVMTISNNVTPRNWSQDESGIGGYVPIEDVAQEIYERGYLMVQKYEQDN